MTKCRCTKGIGRPGTSFFYKVLSSLKQLQSHKKYCNGASLDDIAKFMNKKYILCGDICSQVENALCTAEGYKFVLKKKNIYTLLCPAATLQLTPGPCFKAKLERIQEIFNSEWHEGSRNGTRRSTRNAQRNSHSPPHFIPCIETPVFSTNKSNHKNSKSRSRNLECTSESPVLDNSSIKSFLKSIKSCDCSPVRRNLRSRSSNQSKKNLKKGKKSSRRYSKRKRRGRSPSPSQPKKKKRISYTSPSSSNENMPDCNSEQILVCDPNNSSDDLDSDSSEC